jgi:serine/threonine-protein kinase
MALRTRVWRAGKLLILSAALLATYLIFAAAAMRLALRAREVQIPDLTNQTATDATTLAANLGLTVRLDEVRRVDPNVPAGRVLAQDPAPGTTARAQRRIRIWLSAGSRAAAVPDLGGQSERASQVRLAEDGLGTATVAEIRSEAYPADLVVAQDPPSGGAGPTVTLLVNRGEQATNYVMPDLIGVNGERAAAILRGLGFRVAIVGSAPYPGIPAGTVIRHSPQAGFQIAPGEPISFEVSR